MAVAASVWWLEMVPPLNLPPTVVPHSTAEEFIVAQLVKQIFGILYESQRMGEDRGVQRVLVGKPEGKRLLGRPRRRWEDNIKMDLQEVGGVVGTGWSWLRIGTGGEHLWVR